jgi:hypothetical protein
LVVAASEKQITKQNADRIQAKVILNKKIIEINNKNY